jgi:hypothetical protein
MRRRGTLVNEFILLYTSLFSGVTIPNHCRVYLTYFHCMGGLAEIVQGNSCPLLPIIEQPGSV